MSRYANSITSKAEFDDLQTLRTSKPVAVGGENTIVVNERTVSIETAMRHAREQVHAFLQAKGAARESIIKQRLELGRLLCSIKKQIGQRANFTALLKEFGISRKIAHSAMALAAGVDAHPGQFDEAMRRPGTTLRQAELAVGARKADVALPVGAQRTGDVRSSALPVGAQKTDEGNRVMLVRRKDVAGQMTFADLREQALALVELMQRLIARVSEGDEAAAGRLMEMLRRAASA